MQALLATVLTQFVADIPAYDARLTAAGADAVVIRSARQADLQLLRDLAELDSAKPLTGPVLVALVDGRPSAALSLDDGRAIADPFQATAASIELLALRAQQLCAAEPRPQRSLRSRWIAFRARMTESRQAAA